MPIAKRKLSAGLSGGAGVARPRGRRLSPDMTKAERAKVIDDAIAAMSKSSKKKSTIAKRK